MIICCHRQIGVSTLAREIPNVIDLDFIWAAQAKQDLYLTQITMLDAQKKVVLVSCHLKLRQAMQKAGMKYSVILPSYAERKPINLKKASKTQDIWEGHLDGEDLHYLPEGMYLNDAVRSGQLTID